ncbi:LLM class flavin-dependent oxidoreductase [Rhodococcoides yunnanense]|uniref:LLM class flavin-dependent oxidoreductase n=1 Tax=Rhodococcoides yunnanense TaxID=278209 RepID=UPI0009347426|nr:LLM class flavin-dependent oxidoreductase [Rhodococcus yunnanensis]
MSRPRLLFNAFTMNTVTHVSYGSWTREDSRQTEFHTLDPWLELVGVLERGKIDAIFFADVIGLYDDYRGGWDTHVTEGLQIPNHDPSTIASALAAATTDLGIVVTSSVLQDHPFSFARKISTLDHLSGGRIGWNIVTSALENSARNYGLDNREEHDRRYDWAEEYAEVVYKLWEGSWEDDALVQDRAKSIHADPNKIHKIHHRGERYSVEGPHLSAPSPQRTPVIFQAGSSARGRRFSGRHAEGIFISAASAGGAKKVIDDTRRLAVEAGRSASDIKFFQGLSFVVGSTEAEARAKAADLDESFSVEGLLAHRSGGIGIDFGGWPLDTPIADLAGKVQGTQSSIEALINAAEVGTEVTIADFVKQKQDTTRLVGTPEQIADALETWQDAGVDGVNIQYLTTPGTYVDFVDQVIPVLQERGLAQREYAPGALRGKLFGRSNRVESSHPAARWRGAFAASPPVSA